MRRTGLTGKMKSGTSRGADGISGRTRFMADDDYKHGEMDTTEQEKTFGGFMRYTVNIGIACIVIIILLALFAV
jgi:hypothetical protein